MKLIFLFQRVPKSSNWHGASYWHVLSLPANKKHEKSSQHARKVSRNIVSLYTFNVIYYIFFYFSMTIDLGHWMVICLFRNHEGLVVGHLKKKWWLLLSYPGNLVRCTDCQKYDQKVLKSAETLNKLNKYKLNKYIYVAMVGLSFT